MNHFPHGWGRVSSPSKLEARQPNLQQPRDDVYGAYDASYLQGNNPIQHTQQPVVTGTSVLAVKFKDGVVIAADNLGTFSKQFQYSSHPEFFN